MLLRFITFQEFVPPSDHHSIPLDQKYTFYEHVLRTVELMC